MWIEFEDAPIGIMGGLHINCNGRFQLSAGHDDAYVSEIELHTSDGQYRRLPYCNDATSIIWRDLAAHLFDEHPEQIDAFCRDYCVDAQHDRMVRDERLSLRELI